MNNPHEVHAWLVVTTDTDMSRILYLLTVSPNRIWTPVRDNALLFAHESDAEAACSDTDWPEYVNAWVLGRPVIRDRPG